MFLKIKKMFNISCVIMNILFNFQLRQSYKNVCTCCQLQYSSLNKRQLELESAKKTAISASLLLNDGYKNGYMVKMHTIYSILNPIRMSYFLQTDMSVYFSTALKLMLPHFPSIFM